MNCPRFPDGAKTRRISLFLLFIVAADHFDSFTLHTPRVYAQHAAHLSHKGTAGGTSTRSAQRIPNPPTRFVAFSRCFCVVLVVFLFSAARLPGQAAFPCGPVQITPTRSRRTHTAPTPLAGKSRTLRRQDLGGRRDLPVRHLMPRTDYSDSEHAPTVPPRLHARQFGWIPRLQPAICRSDALWGGLQPPLALACLGST